MISIIICSRNADIPELLKKNIEITIGVLYETIVIDNSKNRYSIFSAYNEGVRRAKYPLLCFMHEDILFHSNMWGVKVIHLLNDKEIGLIGVIGGHYLPDCPASWWSTEYRSGQIIQGYFDEGGQYLKELQQWTSYKNEVQNSVCVSAVDGLWFCMNKKLFEYIRFDDTIFSGFHFYDIDICMQVHKVGYSVRVAYDILIEHKSYGNQDRKYFEEREKCFQKWKTQLPLVKGIKLDEKDVYERCELVKEVNKEQKRRLSLENELKKARDSHAYRLGRFILSPIKYIFNNFH